MSVLDHPGPVSDGMAWRVQRWFDDDLKEAAAEAIKRFAETMTKKLRFYGGPWHGQIIAVKQDAMRIYASDHQVPRPDLGYCNRPIKVEPPPEPVSYRIETYYQTSGSFYRKIEIAILEGADLFPHEQHELRRAFNDIPWEILQPASILYEFAEWWRQTVYKHTGQLIRY